MPSGWEQLGDAMFGGPDPNAYDAGRLHTAQTEGALATARTRQLDAVAKEVQARAIEDSDRYAAEAGVPPAQAALIKNIAQGGYGSDFNAGMSGLKTGQGMHYTDIIGNPNADPAAQYAAANAVKGEINNPYAMVGDAFVDLRAPVAPGAPAPLQQTPLGEAKVGAEGALTNLRNVQAGDPDYQQASGSGTGPGGLKAPQNYMDNPTYDRTIPASTSNPPFVPIPGTPADPNVGPAMGTRERAVIGRVFNAAANTVNDIETIVKMPSGADQGMLGVGLGAQPGVSVMDAVAGDMKRSLTNEEVINYNSTLGGFSSQLRTLEQMGIQGSQGAAAQFDSLAFTPQDSVGTKMYKLSQVRQTVENAVGTILALNGGNMPDAAKQWGEQAINGIKRAVPYTRDDVIAFRAQSARNPRLSLQQMITQRQMTQPVRAPGATAAAPAPTSHAAPVPGAPVITHSEAEYNALPPGALYMMPGETLPRRKQ